MFWQRPPAVRLRRLLASPPSRPDKALAQLQKLLSTNNDLDLNAELTERGAEPALPLTLALGDAWVAAGQAARAVALLLDAGAVTTWPSDFSGVCHYALALERGAEDAAEVILRHSVAAGTAAGDSAAVAAALGETFVPVIRTALFMDENASPAAQNSATGGKHWRGGERRSGAAGRASAAAEATKDGVEPAVMTDAMNGAAWLVSSLPPGMAETLRPGGAASLVHAILGAFAQRVDAEALKKHALSVSLATADPEQRAAEEAAAAARRSVAVAALLRRLWSLLLLALEAGSPAVDMSVNSFPAPSPRPLCDLDKIWAGVKVFSTAWLSTWTRQSHCMFHPSFRAGVKAFVLAAARGLGGGSGGGERRAVRLDGALVERIVGFMAEDQRAWVSTIGGDGGGGGRAAGGGQ